jgi:hypothetical protein
LFAKYAVMRKTHPAAMRFIHTWLRRNRFSWDIVIAVSLRFQSLKIQFFRNMPVRFLLRGTTRRDFRSLPGRQGRQGPATLPELTGREGISAPEYHFNEAILNIHNYLTQYFTIPQRLSDGISSAGNVQPGTWKPAFFTRPVTAGEDYPVEERYRQLSSGMPVMAASFPDMLVHTLQTFSLHQGPVPAYSQQPQQSSISHALAGGTSPVLRKAGGITPPYFSGSIGKPGKFLSVSEASGIPGIARAGKPSPLFGVTRRTRKFLPIPKTATVSAPSYGTAGPSPPRPVIPATTGHPELHYAGTRLIDTLLGEVSKTMQGVKASAASGHFPTKRPEGKPEIPDHEIRRISDAVMRMIDARLTIERERRGYY